MHTLSTSPAVLTEALQNPAAEDMQGIDGLAPTPRHRLARLLASLRASVAIVTGQYPDGDRPPHPGDRPVEKDPIARLARDFPLFYTHLS
jgi:hypothetical protein